MFALITLARQKQLMFGNNALSLGRQLACGSMAPLLA